MTPRQTAQWLRQTHQTTIADLIEQQEAEIERLHQIIGRMSTIVPTFEVAGPIDMDWAERFCSTALAAYRAEVLEEVGDGPTLKTIRPGMSAEEVKQVRAELSRLSQEARDE